MDNKIVVLLPLSFVAAAIWVAFGYNSTMSTPGPTVEFARALLEPRIADFSLFLEKLGAKDRPKVEKQIIACEAAGTDLLWKRLACALMTLAPHQPKVNAQQSIQFYVADGRHRKQVFALEDPGNSTLTVYCHDIIDQAVKERLLQPATELGPDDNTYRIVGTGDTLFIDRIDGDVINPTEFFKHMVGWNRKALRIKLPVTASEAQISTVETICAMSMSGH